MSEGLCVREKVKLVKNQILVGNNMRNTISVEQKGLTHNYLSPCFNVGAEGGTRTLTVLPPADFESKIAKTA